MKIPIIYWPLEFTLKMCSFWPGQYSILGPLLVASSLITLIPFQCWDALLIDTPLVLMDSLSDIITEFLLYTKLFVMWSKRRYIVDMLKEIGNDYKDNTLSDDKWPKLHAYAHKFCKYDYGWYMGATLLYYFQLILVYVTAPVEYRLMLLKAYYPFDYKTSPNFELLNLTQVVQGFCMAAVNAMSETLLVTLVLYVGSHVESLKDQINKFSSGCKIDAIDDVIDHANVHHLIENILKQHLKVLNLVKNLETFYTYVSLAQLFFSSLTICVTGFVILLALQSGDIVLLIKFVMFMIILLWQAFSFCYVGQYLLDKNEEVAAALYDSYWYNVESKEARSLAFMLKKMQIPLELTAGKFVRLSTQSFCTIIKTSFSYLSVLRAAYI